MKIKKYILALDQGTTSSRALLFGRNQSILGIEQQETTQLFPQPGWVEQNAEEISTTQIGVARMLIRRMGVSPSEIAGIGITNQRETTIIWDKITGNPVYNAIVWQDKRTSAYCNQLKKEGWETYIAENTGLVIDSYFSATKIKWILDQIPGVRKKAENGELCFGTVDTWLIWNLSGGKLHITDYSNASRTMLFNINTLEWDPKLLNLFGIPASLLPQVRNSSEKYGEACTEFLTEGCIPIAGIAGDQQAALFGQTCFTPGMVKNTYGTGCFMLMNTGNKRVFSKNGLVSTLAWGMENKVTYALEGSVFIAGAAVKWLRDGLKIIQSAKETEELALSVNDTEGVYVIPAFSGLGAPYWDMAAKGAILGLSQGTSVKHLVRATLEALAYQTRDVIEAMKNDCNLEIPELQVDGGASVNNFLMQFQADILNLPVRRPDIIESTAFGAAMLAALSTGFWSMDEIVTNRRVDRTFAPHMTEPERNRKYEGWKEALRRILS